MRRRAAGFTLIELLVAMGVVGILLAAIMSWQSLTLDTSARVQSDAARLQELSDASGYLSDRVRGAVGVRLSGFTVNAASAPAAGKCQAATPCLALLVPNWNAAAGTSQINECLSLVYRFEPRFSAPSQDVERDPWAESPSNTESFVLREYRQVNPTSSGDCSGALLTFNAAAAFAGFQPAIVADHLSLSSAGGSAFLPFEYAGSDVTLRFQNKQRVRGKTYATPADAPYEVRIRPRNF